VGVFWDEVRRGVVRWWDFEGLGSRGEGSGW
jgi:hypothetical protein